MDHFFFSVAGEEEDKTMALAAARWTLLNIGTQPMRLATGSAPRALFHASTGLQAGHSKWANIKHRKGRQDENKMNNFCKFSRAITVAAKVGGGDDPSNHKLEIAVSKARAVNMPKDKIQAAIDKVCLSLSHFLDANSLV